MYFDIKNYLKNNSNYTTKYSLRVTLPNTLLEYDNSCVFKCFFIRNALKYFFIF